VCGHPGTDPYEKVAENQAFADFFVDSAADGMSGSHLAQDRPRGFQQMTSNSPDNDAPHDEWGFTNAEGEGQPPVLWRFLNGPREAFCLLHPHPIGFELRYMLDGVQLIGVVSTDVAELRQRAEQWRGRLVLEGWAEVEAKVQPFARVRSTGSR
jgi:hypothetical protein